MTYTTMSFIFWDFPAIGLAQSNHVSHAFGLLTASREHTEPTEFHGKQLRKKCTENACGAGMHGRTKVMGDFLIFFRAFRRRRRSPCILIFSVKLCVLRAFRGYSK
ncbi:hypothetical protein [Methanorbis rubei]|uniref:hypothetical protein n=1 Tax=Methanorbis rubei TaxID=3028300 RepID=UPI0030B8DBBD